MKAKEKKEQAKDKKPSAKKPTKRGGPGFFVEHGEKLAFAAFALVILYGAYAMFTSNVYTGEPSALVDAVKGKVQDISDNTPDVVAETLFSLKDRDYLTLVEQTTKLPPESRRGGGIPFVPGSNFAKELRSQPKLLPPVNPAAGSRLIAVAVKGPDFGKEATGTAGAAGAAGAGGTAGQGQVGERFPPGGGRFPPGGAAPPGSTGGTGSRFPQGGGPGGRGRRPPGGDPMGGDPMGGGRNARGRRPPGEDDNDVDLERQAGQDNGMQPGAQDEMNFAPRKGIQDAPYGTEAKGRRVIFVTYTVPRAAQMLQYSQFDRAKHPGLHDYSRDVPQYVAYLIERADVTDSAENPQWVLISPDRAATQPAGEVWDHVRRNFEETKAWIWPMEQVRSDVVFTMYELAKPIDLDPALQPVDPAKRPLVYIGGLVFPLAPMLADDYGDEVRGEFEMAFDPNAGYGPGDFGREPPGSGGDPMDPMGGFGVGAPGAPGAPGAAGAGVAPGLGGARRQVTGPGGGARFPPAGGAPPASGPGGGARFPSGGGQGGAGGQFQGRMPPGEDDMGEQMYSGEGLNQSGDLLLRFCDYTAQPGRRYIYRVKLILKNPNYKLSPTYLGDEARKLVDVAHVETDWSEATKEIALAGDSEVLAGPATVREPFSVKAEVILRQWHPASGGKVSYNFGNRERGQLLDFSVRSTKSKDKEGNEYFAGGDPPAMERHPVDGSIKPIWRMEFKTGQLIVDLKGGEKLGKFVSEPAEMLVVDTATGYFDVVKENRSPTAGVSYAIEAAQLKTMLPPRKQRTTTDDTTDPMGPMGGDPMGAYGGGRRPPGER